MMLILDTSSKDWRGKCLMLGLDPSAGAPPPESLSRCGEATWFRVVFPDVTIASRHDDRTAERFLEPGTGEAVVCEFLART